MGKASKAGTFSRAYKDDCFLEWYQLGKPTSAEYWLKMKRDEGGRRPSRSALHHWASDWEVKAQSLDAEVQAGIIDQTIAEKVEMLQRHQKDAIEVQTMALDYLRNHKDDLTPNAAARLLQLGVEIERQSVGVPQALEKMRKLDDEALLGEISSILQDSNVDLELLEE
jgi:hypothetical protein